MAEFSYKDGSLFITAEQSKMRLTWGEQPVAEELDHHGEWQPFFPDFRLLFPAGQASAAMPADMAAALAEFRKPISADIISAAEPFQSHQWALMALMERSPKTRDLAKSNLVLAYALANSHEFRGTTFKVGFQQALMHCRYKQREICAWLKMPPVQSMVNILNKLEIKAVSPSILRRLNYAMEKNDELIKLLCHQKQIRAGLLSFVLTPGLLDCCTPRLLQEVNSLQDPMPAYVVSDQFSHVMQIRKEMNAADRIRKFQTLHQIESFAEKADRAFMEHQRRIREVKEEKRQVAEAAARTRRAAAARLRQKSKRKPKECPWPPPPIPGNDHIQPITSYSMLEEESQAQNNCIRSYWSSIVNDDSGIYPYRLLEPERATFTIVRIHRGLWRLSEVKGKANKEVSAKARAAVEHWLHSHNFFPTQRCC